MLVCLISIFSVLWDQISSKSESLKLLKSLHVVSLQCVCVCSPDAADSSSFDVQLGDIILTATDGLFDNMPDYMILQELKKLKVSHAESQTSLCTEVKSEILWKVDTRSVSLLRTQTTRASSKLPGALQNRPTFWHMTPTTCRLLHSLPVTMDWM